MPEPESDIEQLSHGAGPGSFRVLAEWLRDNRQMLEGRMDRQDKKLEEIHAETRRTNGRVTDLEKSADMANALSQGRAEWDHELDDHEQQRRSRRLTLLVAASTVGGALVTEVGRVLHLW